MSVNSTLIRKVNLEVQIKLSLALGVTNVRSHHVVQVPARVCQQSVR